MLNDIGEAVRYAATGRADLTSVRGQFLIWALYGVDPLDPYLEDEQ
jgi:hypothetical protein